MKKNIILGVLSVFTVFMIVLIVGIYQRNNFSHNVILNAKETEGLKKVNTLSMMYETEANSGIYELSDAVGWPGEGYVFNENLSKCESGSTLIWDNASKSIKLTANVSDKCYVYFDVF